MKKRRSHIFSALLIFVLFMSIAIYTSVHAQTLEQVVDSTIKDTVDSANQIKPVDSTVDSPLPVPTSTGVNPKTVSKEPTIKTEKTPYGNSITIIYPDNYSGEVNTSFENGQWKTNTKQYTEEDMKQMQNDMKKRQDAMQKYFEAQQKFFDEMWGTPRSSFMVPRFPHFSFFPFW